LAFARVTLCGLAALSALSLPVRAASHPPGVVYPLTPAAVQPSGLAHPLPSSRRYVLVWKDQLADATQSISDEQKDFIVTHYVGTQKLFKHQIDEYRERNPNFLMLVYHLAYGLNGSDQTNPVGNITGPDTYGQEDEDNFTPYVAAHTLTRENAYQHSSSPGSTSNRVAYPDPYWLMDLASDEWRSYVYDTLVQWQGYASDRADGVFLDVAFFPWYSYTPDAWWAEPAGDSSRSALRDFWNPLATSYYTGMRAAFAENGEHPRYLVIPNTDALVDGTDEPEFLEGTDGVFTENWQAILSGPGDWNLSARRIAKYATSTGKVWMTDVTEAGTDLTLAERELLIGTYLLLRNGTSYVMFGNSDITWYPEYELDLGAYDDEPPAELEELRVAGDGGSQGGLYLRSHARGLVLVNSSDETLSTTLPQEMRRATFSGGGPVNAAGELPSFTLDYDTVVPAGSFSLEGRAVAVLRDAGGAPPPGEEPGTPGGEAGASGASNGGDAGSGTRGGSSGGSAMPATGGTLGGGGTAGRGSATGGSTNGGAGGSAGRGGPAGGTTGTAGTAQSGAGTTGTSSPASSKSEEDSGCSCRVAPRSSAASSSSGAFLLLILGALRRRGRARRRT
jgi:hypothetical protein